MHDRPSRLSVLRRMVNRSPLGAISGAIALTTGLLAGFGAPASAGPPITLYVSQTGTATTGCTSPGSSACGTLAEAMTAANNDSGANAIIEIAASATPYNLNATIADTSNPSLTIMGAGQSQTVLRPLAAGSSIVINNGTSLTIADLTMSGGSASDGGAISNNSGTLSLDHVSLINDTASTYGGAVYASSNAPITLTNDTLTNDTAPYGGAIASSATTTLTNDTLASDGSNPTIEGGALFLSAGQSATITDSTFSGDQAGYGGAGVYMNTGGTVTASNDTFTADTANYGAGIFEQGTVTATNVTFGYDVANAYASAIEDYAGTLTLKASLLDSATCSRTGNGVIVDGGYNLESGNTCGFNAPSGFDVSTLDLATTLAANNSSGPETLALGTSSSAINFVPSTACTLATDERGQKRPGYAGRTSCDAGAFEFQGANPSAPSGVTAKPAKRAITITWHRPATIGGVPISQYRIFCSTAKHPSTTGSPRATAAASLRTKTVAHLTGGVRYYCVVAAATSQGISPASSVVSAVPTH